MEEPRLSPRQAPLPALALAALALLPALLAALPAGAQGGEPSLGVTPPQVEVQDAQRGQAYERHVTIQNRFDTPTVVTLEHRDDPANEVGNWTTTEPGSGFTVPPLSDAVIKLAITIPMDAPNGFHAGHLRLVAEPKEQPSGSGFALRYAVAVVLNVTVGGDALLRLQWLRADAEDVEVGSPPLVWAEVTNVGNVRAVARVQGTVARDDEPGAVAMRGTGNLELRPGQTERVPLAWEGPALRLGLHRVEVSSLNPADWNGTAWFQVLEVGQLGKEGVFRYIQHEPWVEPGFPVKVTAVFENIGRAFISGAKFTGEVYLGERLVAVLESDELAVPPGTVANLSDFFTPQTAGIYTIKGKVTFDRLSSPEKDSLVNVRGADAPAAAGGLHAWLLYAAGPALALPLGLFLIQRRRRQRPPGGRARGGPPPRRGGG